MADPVAQGDGMAGLTAFRTTGPTEAGNAEAPPLLFIHGVGLRKEVWDPQIAAFARNRRVIAYDMLGHGGSGLGNGDMGLDAFVAQAADLLAALGITRADVVGHSMGALVALGLALAHPDRINRLVALNAVYQRTTDQRAAVLERAAEIERVGPRAAADRAVARWFGDTPPPALRPLATQVREWLENADPVGYARAYRIFASSDAIHAGRLPTLAMPVLYLTGELDANSSPAMSDRMAAETPQGRARILPGERHMMAMVSPDAVNTALRAFLNPSTLDGQAA